MRRYPSFRYTSITRHELRVRRDNDNHRADRIHDLRAERDYLRDDLLDLTTDQKIAVMRRLAEIERLLAILTRR